MYHLLLIAGQFVLAAALVLSTKWWPIPWVALLFAFPGAAISIWAWLSVGLLRLRIHPAANDRTRMIDHGPYAWVRHPMYTGLLWFTAPLLTSGFAWRRVILWFALLAVLIAKSQEEEQAMSERFTQYRDYRSKVASWIPSFHLGDRNFDRD
jgi:protein-S-isoprenylcysteine O-methyltransferase Ste14